MRGSYTSYLARQAWERYETEKRKREVEAEEAKKKALEAEAAELKRARIMNRAEPGYERKDGKL